MPIIIPKNLPATDTLLQEGVDVIDAARAHKQDIRPLEIALLNLMPLKVPTETQIARLLGSSPLQVNLTLVIPSSYEPKNTPKEHLDAFYERWLSVKHKHYDGFIITGSPVEHLPFTSVAYWEELREVLQWAERNVFSTFCICWAAQAQLFEKFGINKVELPQKRMGIFPHQSTKKHPLVRGLSDIYNVPVARGTTVPRGEIEKKAKGIEVLSVSVDGNDVSLAADPESRLVLSFNHLEYDTETLALEYARDVGNGKQVSVPERYFPNDDTSQPPVNTWRSNANVFVSNWLFEVYERTPYDLTTLEPRSI